MSRIVPFDRSHMPTILAGGEAEGSLSGDFYVNEKLLAGLEQQNSWTLLATDDTPIACGGIIELWKNRYMCWMYLNKRSGDYMLAVTRAVKAALKGNGKGRYEMAVKYDFAAGHRWAKLLGFHIETPTMLNYGPNGEDCTGYVRIQK